MAWNKLARKSTKWQDKCNRIWPHPLSQGINFTNTGGPCNLQTFYLQICLFLVQECVPNLKIHGLSLTYSRIFYGIGLRITQKLVFLARQCSLVFCSFIIRGSLPEHAYRELRGPPV